MTTSFTSAESLEKSMELVQHSIEKVKDNIAVTQRES